MTNDDKRIFIFDATENFFSDRVFELNKFEGYWEPKPPLFLPRKKISAVYHNNYLYVTGEFENLSVQRSSLERYDILNEIYEEIHGMNK